MDPEARKFVWEKIQERSRKVLGTSDPNMDLSRRKIQVGLLF